MAEDFLWPRQYCCSRVNNLLTNAREVNGKADFVACAKNMSDFAVAEGFVGDGVANSPVVFVGVGFVEVRLGVFEFGFAVGGGPALGEGAGDSGENVVAREFAEEYRGGGYFAHLAVGAAFAGVGDE